MADQPGSGRPERLLQIVTGALECEPGTRSLFLDRACGDDTELRTEAESLLSLDGPSREFIARPAIAAYAEAFVGAECAVRHATMFQPGQTLGEFRIDSLLGEGGMGEVYLAEDTSLGRLVALKIIKAGMASQTLRRRFDEEKRILAGLNDPHIARLYGGAVTPEGLPYLVMEYVEGEPLGEYCDKRRLPIEERLTLFRKVCSAVAYAHQHLVIHRDLKPANIRVTPEGEPKLLDFGIAKLLDPQAGQEIEQTVTRLGAMTPVYASPEQLRGETVTTATDIYSLGVVLYELLSGQRPFDPKKRRPGDFEHVIREETAPRPSSIAAGAGVAEARGLAPGRLSRRLAGDLDNIVLMAMRPDPARRYASVSQFSEDIQRHLDTQPVTARKETFRYVAAKFITRNKALAAAAALALLTLIGGIVATTWQARRAEEQRRRADRRFEDVRRLADSLMGEIHDSVQTLAGSTPTRKLIVTRALEYLDSLSKEADTPALRRDLAAAYEKIGDVQGNPYYANLGDTDGAMASYRKAADLLQSLTAAGVAAPPEVRMAQGRIYRALGDIDDAKGDYAATVRRYRQSLEIFAQLARETPSDPAVIDELARAWSTLADGLDRTENGRTEQIRCFEQALAFLQRLVDQAPGNVKYRRSMAVNLMKLGAVSVGDKARGLAYITRGVAGLKALSDENPDNVQARRTYAVGLQALGAAQSEAGDDAGAVSTREKGLAIREQIAKADAKDEQARFDLGAASTDIAESLTKTGQPDKALNYARQSTTIHETLMTADPRNTGYMRNGRLAYEQVGNAHAALASRESLEVSERLAHWIAAKAAYQRSSQLFSDLSARGAVRSTDAEASARLKANIARCEAGIEQLRK